MFNFKIETSQRKPFKKYHQNIPPFTTVPVCHFFGFTLCGLSVCCHLHNLFPYIHVRLPPEKEINFSQKLIGQLESQLCGESKRRCVYRTEIVRAFSIYGYESSESDFVKIYFFDPNLIFNATRAIENMGLQPFESHIPFNLQICIDLNISGVSQIQFTRLTRRKLHNNKCDKSDCLCQFPPDKTEHQPITTCDIEIDVHYKDIVQSNERSEGKNYALARLAEDLRNQLPGSDVDSSFPADGRHFDRTDGEFVKILRDYVQKPSDSPMEQTPFMDSADVELAEKMDQMRQKTESESSDDQLEEELLTEEMSLSISEICCRNPRSDFTCAQHAHKRLSNNYKTYLQTDLSRLKGFDMTLFVPEEIPSDTPPKASTGSFYSAIDYESTIEPDCSGRSDFCSGTIKLSVLCLEVFGDNSEGFLPNPEFDSIRVVVCCHRGRLGGSSTWFVILLQDERLVGGDKLGVEFEIKLVYTEADLIEGVIDFVVGEDPDLLLGYETEKSSWGFVIRRAVSLGIDFAGRIGRIRFMEGTDDVVTGRVVLNLWRIVKHELSLMSYSIEDVVRKLMKADFSQLPNTTLLRLYRRSTRDRTGVIHYFMRKCRLVVEILDKLSVVDKAVEFSRIYGIEFRHVLSRGTQYRVESMLLRLARSLNFLCMSPNPRQREQSAKTQHVPLVLEPTPSFHRDPVVVLDFQSLYPSIVIAYNYCYSTCLGRLGNIVAANGRPFPFGCGYLSRSTEEVERLVGAVSVAPSGGVFVDKSVRRGLLPELLEEILDCRILCKKVLKRAPKNSAQQNAMDFRQLGLKLIANVIYGYTAAENTGRMPCVEVGDGIISKARETLEKTIRLVESRFGARVIYGDTDSLFVLLRGSSLENAFRLGEEMARAVTLDNPNPVKLRFERVYYPCLLLAKKRYAGLSHQNPADSGTFQAKGIETVRRDSCRLTSKVLKTALKILFSAGGTESAEIYIKKQILKVYENRCEVADFVYCKKFRGFDSYSPRARVPVLEIAKRMRARDCMDYPLSGSRVPYLILEGSGRDRLINLVRHPRELSIGRQIKLNIDYYVERGLMPPLERVFAVFGVEVVDWPLEVKRNCFPPESLRRGTLLDYFKYSRCLSCHSLVVAARYCAQCRSEPERLNNGLVMRFGDLHNVREAIDERCRSCSGFDGSNSCCCSWFCPLKFKFMKDQYDYDKLKRIIVSRDLF